MRRLICAQFERYHKARLFIDCVFVQEGGAEIPCHRLVLARHSKFMRELFCSRDGELPLSLPVPFDLNRNFERVIEYFYTHSFEIGSSICRLTELLVLAKVYGCDDLEMILQDEIQRILSKENVLELAKPFTQVAVDPKMLEMYAMLGSSFPEMESSVSLFSQVIADNFGDYILKELYHCVTPLLLAEVLKKLDTKEYPSDRKVGIIDAFVAETAMPSMRDREGLQEVVKWDEPDSYLLFANHVADWVPPRISRPAISKVISNRRKTLYAFEQAVEREVGAGCVNWYAFSWICNVRQSKVVDDIGDVEVTKFLGTLGGCCEEINPMLYRLLKPYCSLALQVEQFEDLLFDRETLSERYTYYFLSQPNSTGAPFVGYDFITPCFAVKSVKVILQLGKPIPKHLRVRTFVGDTVTYSGEFDVPVQEEVDLPICPPGPVQRVKVEMVKKNTAGSHIMRVLALKVCGHFTASNVL